ncbi:MAG: hypothetical protein A3G24_18215 [Betaproteobacteria bacterium RIFCSPLOWO2_12_FULL_62_13]|nr:MAG: hypothetical protein A3G24_18215 [Betaproteobacteria bacterium RIFCSPLOWO2_12_FULL_62_13]
MVITKAELPVTPRECREVFRRGEWNGPTTGLCIGYTNANLVIVPESLAYDFLLFCQRNPKPCPLLEVLEPGDPTVKYLAKGADIRTDLPRYRVFVKGELVEEPTDVKKYWRDDLVAFLFGCSSTFEGALEKAGIRPTWREGRRLGAFITNIQCTPAGRLQGPMVVSMRPIPAHQVAIVVQVTARFPTHHGAPIHIGDPAAIGIKDITKPYSGGPSDVRPGEVPVFWACGVTPQTVALESKPELMLTHSPGHMFLSDIPSDRQAIP